METVHEVATPEREIPVDVKRALVEAEIADYCRVKYQAEMRSRVCLKIGDTAALENLKTDLVRIETALEALDAELDSLSLDGPRPRK
jgi:hypothetical protein